MEQGVAQTRWQRTEDLTPDNDDTITKVEADLGHVRQLQGTIVMT